jgi:hypothetical protein
MGLHDEDIQYMVYPTHFDQFFEQLPTTVEDCSGDLMFYKNCLFSLKEGDSSAIQIMKVLVHLRYRYIVLNKLKDPESLAYKCLYLSHLPRMRYQDDELSSEESDLIETPAPQEASRAIGKKKKLRKRRGGKRQQISFPNRDESDIVLPSDEQCGTLCSDSCEGKTKSIPTSQHHINSAMCIRSSVPSLPPEYYTLPLPSDIKRTDISFVDTSSYDDVVGTAITRYSDLELIPKPSLSMSARDKRRCSIGHNYARQLHRASIAVNDSSFVIPISHSITRRTVSLLADTARTCYLGYDYLAYSPPNDIKPLRLFDKALHVTILNWISSITF